MSNITVSVQESLDYHEFPNPGKLGTQTTVSFSTQKDLALAYTPGVANPCLEIQKDPHNAYKYTSKANLVAVISNGTAVLGLGDIGALASKPVMEGKSVLFKNFAAVDSFDIELNQTSIDDICKTVEAISPTFGGINLEDIKAPECFEIERRLVEALDIPVMHDDQHGTAIISSAALMGASELIKKDLKSLKVIIIGAGAAAISCGRMYKSLGITNIIMYDSKGQIHKHRDDLNKYKLEFATDKSITRHDAFANADVVLGLSVPGTISLEDVSLMADEPMIFALANPTPELMPDDIRKIRDKAIIATGRSDFDNQVNNVLGFPFIFRGALDVRAKKINMAMKIAAAKALHELTKKPVPQEIRDTYGNQHISFAKDYIIPKPFDKRLIVEISSAVAKAAVDSGVAQIKDFDYEKYKEELKRLL
jgi:malate dehydrogenase (oxaloacetate-decarboxylating)/malate dehydrogenase (oxaloacetate-decarboxylating)(NADP+)